MTDEELVNMLRNRTRDGILKENDRMEAANRIEVLAAQVMEAYAKGYSDAESEISVSAIGQQNSSLHEQLTKAKAQIGALTLQVTEVCTERDEFLNSAWRNGIAKQSAEASNARLRKALLPCINMLDSLVIESGKSVDYDAEDAFRMGEWFEDEELAAIEIARTTLEETL